MEALYYCRVTSPEPRKIYFGLAEGKWKNSIITIKSHSTANDVHMRRHFVRHLNENLDLNPNLKCSVVGSSTPCSNISKKCLLFLYEKLVIITYPRQHELLNKDRSYFVNAVMRISTFWKTLELITKVNQIFSQKENFIWINESLFVETSHKKKITYLMIAWPWNSES